MAGVVLAMGLLAGLELVARTAAATSAVQDRSRGLIFARSKMEEILKEPVLQVGTDRGEGVDDGTDYDWEAVIEESQHPALVLIIVNARNRNTDHVVSISALRRPDIQTTAEEETGTTTESEPAAGETPGGGT